MRRKILDIAAALSLVLCVVTVAFWVRSYWAWDTVSHRTNWRPDPSGTGKVYHASLLMHAEGKITFESFRDWTVAAPPYEQRPGWGYARSTMTAVTPPTASVWNRVGFSVVRDDVVFPPSVGRE